MAIDKLYSAYLGELYGISFFSTFIEKYSDNRHNNKWLTLLKIEEITARELKIGLTHLGKICPEYDEEMHQKGIKDANKWLALPWPTLVDTMVNWVAPYQQAYQQQADSAQQYQDLFDLVADHENAIYDYLLAEQAQDPHSMRILTDFINRYNNA